MPAVVLESQRGGKGVAHDWYRVGTCSTTILAVK